MNNYYVKKLCDEKLMRCYKIAPPRIQQYLNAEIQHVLESISSDCRVLELGCGYGRVLQHLTKKSRSVFGIDISASSIELARQMLRGISTCHLFVMNAVRLGFKDNTFERVFCVQNGISAFHVDQRALISESIRVTKNRGLVLYSSYSAKIWPERLHWFKLQAEAGLLGEIDWQQTRNGVIVCKDGFTARTLSSEQFRDLTADLPVDVTIEEVDESSRFLVLTMHKGT
ncbi:MAG: class I SAM-dependent methyltransferase [bacterium]